MGFFKSLFSKEKKRHWTKVWKRPKKGRFQSKQYARAIAGRSTIDDDFLDELEEIFITSDVGTETTSRLSTVSRNVSHATNMSTPRNSTACCARKLPICSQAMPTKAPTASSACPQAKNRM